ncbi:MAG: ATP cone domain-containing protein [Thermoplasmata archaeon]
MSVKKLRIDGRNLKMIYVTKEGSRFPFSKGILARSLTITGLTLDERYEIVKEINKEFEESGRKEIPSKEIKEKVQNKLLNKGYKEEEKFYRVSRKIRYLERPILILIGGGPGVGKSTLSSELGHRLGINRIVGGDTVREIMRTMLSYELVPPLHESTFMTDKIVKAPFVSNKLIHGYDQQVSLVSVGINAVIYRGIKEGLNSIINGVHIVPGYLDLDKKDCCYIFQYILEVPDLDEHIERFKSRAEGSHRDPSRYIDRINKIREIQEYTIQQAIEHGAKVIKNKDMETTIRNIMEDVISNLESEV